MKINSHYYVALTVKHDKNIKNKKIFSFSKKWPFLATFGRIAISQPKRIQIKK